MQALKPCFTLVSVRVADLPTDRDLSSGLLIGWLCQEKVTLNQYRFSLWAETNPAIRIAINWGFISLNMHTMVFVIHKMFRFVFKKTTIGFEKKITTLIHP